VDDTLMYSSMLEIFTFLFIMGRETFKIYIDRATLLEKQKNHQQEIISAIVNSQEQERNKVGAELHDMIGANISVIKQNVDSENTGLNKIIDDTVDTVRKLSHGLMTPKVSGDSFANEIKDLCLLSSNENMKVEYYFHNWEAINDKEISTHLFRIVQELLQNALKHSNASRVHIQFFREKNTIQFTYEDNGVGFDIKNNKENGRGFINIKHRTKLISGALTIESSPGNGLSIMITLSLSN
jgi:signal transduction histidine kinase